MLDRCCMFGVISTHQHFTSEMWILVKGVSPTSSSWDGIGHNDDDAGPPPTPIGKRVSSHLTTVALIGLELRDLWLTTSLRLEPSRPAVHRLEADDVDITVHQRLLVLKKLAPQETESLSVIGEDQ